MSDDGELKPMETEPEERPPASPPAASAAAAKELPASAEKEPPASAEKEPPASAEKELDEYLEGASCWKSFEDVEDEVHYLRHRGDALARGLLAAREEIAHLHEAGHRLQKAYESLHQQYREVSADAVYWQSLAEARAQSSEAAQACRTGSIFQEQRLMAIAESGSPAPKEALRHWNAEAEATISPEPASPVDLDPREALRRAAVEASEALQRKGNRKKKVETSPRLTKGVPTTSPTKLRSRDFESLLTRTPPRKARSEEGSPSPCTPGLRALSASLSGGYLSRPSLTSSRKWGIGSSPKRCPGLGTPTRRGKVDPDFLARSPLRQ